MYHMKVTTAMIADAARVEGGKLFVHGGGWDRINVAGLPALHPTLALALVFEVGYDEALTDHELMIQLLDEDDQPLGPEISGMINVGHPAGSKRGAPVHVPQAITIQLIQFERAGRYRFKLSVGNRELASVPFEVATSPSGGGM
jgi:hypothetical protein